MLLRIQLPVDVNTLRIESNYDITPNDAVSDDTLRMENNDNVNIKYIHKTTYLGAISIQFTNTTK